MPSAVLSHLIRDLASGAVRVLDLSAPLEPETPVIELPAQFAPSPPVSRYDERIANGSGSPLRVLALVPDVSTTSQNQPEEKP